MDKDTAYCRDLLVRHDYDRYVLAQGAPAPARPALWALYAFNHEIARARESGRDPHAALIRLAWWSETLAKGDTDTEILRALKLHGFDAALLEAMIDARRMDVEASAPATIDGMAAYAEACNAPLLKLAAKAANEILGEDDANNLAAAYGLCGLIRAVPYMAAQGRCLLPASMMYDIGIMPEQMHLLGPSQKLNAGIATIAARAKKHHDASYAQGPLAKRHKSLVSFYLKRMAKAGFDPFDVRVHSPVPFIGLRLMFQDQK